MSLSTSGNKRRFTIGRQQLRSDEKDDDAASLDELLLQLLLLLYI